MYVNPVEDARRKFEEHESNFSFLVALQTSKLHPDNSICALLKAGTNSVITWRTQVALEKRVLILSCRVYQVIVIYPKTMTKRQR